MVSKMRTSDALKLDTSCAEAKVCPRCGERGLGPYRRRVGRGKHFGFYYKHTLIESGARRTIWHYVRRRESAGARQKKLVQLVKQHGWCGTSYFAALLGVSGCTIWRDLDVLRKEGKIIHQPYGSYIADPSGTLLKEKPWIAWS